MALNQWPDMWTPEALHVLNIARIVKTLGWTYRDLQETPADWLRQVLAGIVALNQAEAEQLRTRRH